MKKILCLALSVVLLMGAVFAFTSCAKEEPKTTAPAETNETKTEAKLVTVQEGKLIMATNAYFPPYEYYEGDKIVGIDAEIAQAVADKLGLELVIQDMEFTLGPSKTHKALCSAITYGDTTVFTITKNTVSPVFEEKMCSLLAREGLNPTVEGSPNYEY